MKTQLIITFLLFSSVRGYPANNEEKGEKKNEKRGIYDTGNVLSNGYDNTYDNFNNFNNIDSLNANKLSGVSINTVRHEIPVSVPQPYQVTINRPYPVHIPHLYPLVIPRPVPVKIPQPYTVSVPKPYPITVYKHVPVQIPVQQPYPVAQPVRVDIPQPYTVNIPQIIPIRIPHPIVYKYGQPFYLGTTGSEYLRNKDLGYRYTSINSNPGDIFSTTENTNNANDDNKQLNNPQN